MYSTLKNLVLKILKVPAEPADPMGDVRSLRVFRASINYYRYRFYFWLIKHAFGHFIQLGIAGGIFFGIFLGNNPPIDKSATLIVFFLIAGTVIFISLVNTLFSYVVLRLDYEMRWYKISDRSLRIREGVVKVKEMTMTFANIQNISIIQGPVQRLFKIADLKVESAGGSTLLTPEQNLESSNMHVAYFRGVDNAAEISSIMKQRLKILKGAGLGDQDDQKQELNAVSEITADESGSRNILDSLKAIRDEARLFRLTVEQQNHSS